MLPIGPPGVALKYPMEIGGVGESLAHKLAFVVGSEAVLTRE